jgi:DNA-binding response OmpR family regulator
MRVLLVEDDSRLGPQLKSALEYSGYAVDLLSDGCEAETLGASEPYDIVLLDLGLPGRSGLEILGRWRAHGYRVPVIVLTARSSWQEKVEGFKAGADDYIGKPFQIEELIARMGAVLKRSRGVAAGPLSVGSVTLDEDARRLVGPDGRSVELTGIEFRLLRCFMLHPGQVLSKTQLTEHVYHYDGERDSNVIEVYVNRLRQKLGPDLIPTRRGHGYVFGAKS